MKKDIALVLGEAEEADEHYEDADPDDGIVIASEVLHAVKQNHANMLYEYLRAMHDHLHLMMDQE